MFNVSVKKCFASLSLLTLLTATSLAEDAINKPTLSQWIKPAETGLFECQVLRPVGITNPTALQNALVELIASNGKRATGITDKNGIVKIPGISPGDYTLAVWGQDCVAWQAMHFVAQDDERYGNLPSLATIFPANISLTLFQKITDPYLLASPDLAKLKSKITAEENPSRETESDLLPQVARHDGGMKGRLTNPFISQSDEVQIGTTTPAENHLVFLVDEKGKIRQTVTDEEGSFFIANLEAQLYSIVIVGRNGLGASSVQLVDSAATSTSMRTADGKYFVSIMEVESELTMEITPDRIECFDASLSLDGFALPPDQFGSSTGGGGNLIGAALLGTAAAIGTSAYNASNADSESTDPGGI